MKYPVTVYGDALLRKKAKTIEKDNPKLNEIIENTSEWIIRYKNSQFIRKFVQTDNKNFKITIIQDEVFLDGKITKFIFFSAKAKKESKIHLSIDKKGKQIEKINSATWR